MHLNVNVLVLLEDPTQSKKKKSNTFIVIFSFRLGGMWVLQEVDESGAEVFTVLLPSGTPLPARRHHILSGEGKLSSLCLDIYQRFVTKQPEKLAKVWKST